MGLEILKQEDKISVLNIVDNRWWSGSAHFAVYTTKALMEGGYRTAITGDIKKPAMKIASREGLNAIGGFNPNPSNPVRYLTELNSLLEIIRTGEYRCIISHGAQSHYWAGRVKKKLGDSIRVIRALSDDRKPKVNMISKRIYSKWTDGFIASSSTLIKKYSKAFNLPDHKFALAIGPFDLDEFNLHYKNESEKSPSSDITFGLIARLSPVKGHTIFLKAAAMALSKNSNLKFLISGEEAQVKKTDLESYANDLGISEKVNFTSNYSHPSKPISMIDVGVISSTFSEVICRIGMQYMASGKPVISSDINVLPELVIDNVTGIIVPPENVELLSSAMLKLAENGDLRKQYGAEGKKIANDLFTLTAFVNSIKSMIGEEKEE